VKLRHLITIAAAGAAFAVCPASAASLPEVRTPAPVVSAAITQSHYCFARVRGLDPGRLPPAYLVLQLRVKLSYRNTGKRALIVPLEHEHAIYAAFKPGPMIALHEPPGVPEPAYSPMIHLPADVNPDNPTTPANDVFGLIPAGGELSPAITEEITLAVDRHSLFHSNPDLRGHRVYLKLQLDHRELSPVLDAVLSDRWTKFGVPWTGALRTNTFAIDVPASPAAQPCDDARPESVF
jgi:hypothetical protein